VVIDIFSRYVVAWCVAPFEDGELAKELIADAVARHRVPPGQLTIHLSRGSSMTSNPVTELLTCLGIGRSHSHPHVSNDNPYFQSRFRTLKYCPAFPARFGCIEEARMFYSEFFAYYSHEHRHSGIGYHAPASVHYGTAEEVRSHRAKLLVLGVDVQTTAAILGHSSVSITQRYAHVVDELRADAAQRMGDALWGVE